jgi:hypothetical protein
MEGKVIPRHNVYSRHVIGHRKSVTNNAILLIQAKRGPEHLRATICTSPEISKNEVFFLNLL